MPDASSPATITVAIISDTHGELDQRIIDIVNQADIAVHAGDIGNVDILEKMQPKTGSIYAVAGNNDHPVMWPSGQSIALASIPNIAKFDLPGGSIAIEHGDRHDLIAPDHQSLRKAFPEAKLIIYGHTHKMIVDDQHLPWVVNPGAAGTTRTHGGPSCLVLTASESNWEIESYRFND